MSVRGARGLSQAQLAAGVVLIVGVSRQTVNSIETGRYTPVFWLTPAVSVGLGVAMWAGAWSRASSTGATSGSHRSTATPPSPRASS